MKEKILVFKKIIEVEIGMHIPWLYGSLRFYSFFVRPNYCFSSCNINEYQANIGVEILTFG